MPKKYHFNPLSRTHIVLDGWFIIRFYAITAATAEHKFLAHLRLSVIIDDTYSSLSSSDGNYILTKFN